jgi:hypothetical protein
VNEGGRGLNGVMECWSDGRRTGFSEGKITKETKRTKKGRDVNLPKVSIGYYRLPKASGTFRSLPQPSVGGFNKAVFLQGDLRCKFMQIYAKSGFCMCKNLQNLAKTCKKKI